MGKAKLDIRTDIHQYLSKTRMVVDNDTGGLSRSCHLFHFIPRPYEISVNFFNISTLIVFTHSVGRLFHSITVLRDNEYFLTSNLHSSFIDNSLKILVYFWAIQVLCNAIISITRRE